jgi:hypothetical protein
MYLVCLLIEIHGLGGGFGLGLYLAVKFLPRNEFDLGFKSLSTFCTFTDPECYLRDLLVDCINLLFFFSLADLWKGVFIMRDTAYGLPFP